MTARSDTTNAVPVKAFLMGSLLGVAAGLLFAPKSGRESRAALRQSARENLDKVQQKVREKREVASTAVNKAADTAQNVITGGQAAAEDAKSQLNAVKPGKRTPLT